MNVNETRTWAAVIVLGVVLILSMLLDIRARRRTARTLRKHWPLLLQIEGEATSHRGGRPRSSVEGLAPSREGGR